MAMIPVAEALARILASVAAPVSAEDVALDRAAGRTLAADVAALRTQPPFIASAMDGYAVRAADADTVPVVLDVVGTSAAGRGFAGVLGPGQAVRIFTGAPLPAGADAVVIQEDTDALEGQVRIREAAQLGRHIRSSGLDFREGEIHLHAGQRLDARRLALAAAMGHPSLPVRRKPRVAILATGDELVRPGEPAGPDQIVASNPYALQAIVERAGGEAIDIGIAGDTIDDLVRHIDKATALEADLLITLGGASVGEHDLVQPALVQRGMELGFLRVALLGDASAGEDPSEAGVLGIDLPANDQRQDYMRASLGRTGEGGFVASPQKRQDSSMLATLADSEALVVRAPHDPAAKAGDPCRLIRMDRFC